VNEGNVVTVEGGIMHELKARPLLHMRLLHPRLLLHSPCKRWYIHVKYSLETAKVCIKYGHVIDSEVSDSLRVT